MGLQYSNLDHEPRTFAEAELDLDIDAGNLYISPRLTEDGQARYPEMLRSAIRDGTDDTLADALRAHGILATHEVSHRLGKTYEKRVPVNAPETLGEGEFNRFYLRGLCRRAIDQGIGSVLVYRAREAGNPRPESEALIGQGLDPQSLLDDLRSSIGVDTAFGLPPGPNSGLSARLP